MTYARYAIETEDHIRVVLRKKMAHPAQAHSLDVGAEAYLYLPHYAAEQALAEEPLAISLAKRYELYLLDVRGLGESLPDEEGPFWHSYGMDYMFHGHGVLFRQSYLGRRVLDTLSTIDLLVEEGARGIHLYGRGQGAVVGLFAALLHESVSTVTLKNAPGSFQEWIDSPLVFWPAASFLRGVLEHFCLQDCLEALGDRITVLEPWDAQMKPVTEVE